MGRLTKNEKILIDYFTSKNYQKQGFLKFGYWSRRIKNLLGTELNQYQIRKVFCLLVDRKFFNIQKLEKKIYLYQFTDKKHKYIDNYKLDKPIVITFE